MENQQYSFFFSDIVGYSKMVERDESLAYRLLQEHNSIIEKSVTENEGRVVKYIGDSVFAEFESPDNACTASMKIQENLKQRNLLSRRDEQIHIRLGIHTGDAIREEGDLFGNDINIASRIEGVAQVDCVFISKAVLQNLASPQNYHSRKIEHVKLKNIHAPQTLYKLYLSKQDKEGESSSELMNALVEIGVNFVDKNSILDHDIKSIGILVFESLNDEFIGYGLSNELITDFNSINQIYVSDIQDVMFYRSSDFTLIDIARKLEVDNILDGVCRVEENRVHVSIRMVSMESGRTIWKEELSELSANINILRGNILKKVLNLLDVQVPDKILKKLSTGMTTNPAAYKLYHEGLYKVEIIRNTEEYPIVKALFSKAIKKDEQFVEAYAQLAITAFKMGHIEEAEEIIDAGMEKAEEFGKDMGKAKLLLALGIINGNSVKMKKAARNFEKALKIQIKFEDQLAEAKTLNNLSQCYISLGEPDKGIDLLNKSIHLKLKLEKDDLLGPPLATLGTAYRNKFKYGKAIENYNKAIGKFSRAQNDYQKGRTLVLLVRCFCDMGIADKARDYLQQAQEICQRFNEPHIMGSIKQFEAYINLLRKDYDGVISCYEQSLENFRDGELRKPSVEIMMEMMSAHIIFGQNEKLESLKKKFERMSKKMASSDESDTLIDCIDYYMKSNTDTTPQLDFHKLEEAINGIHISETQCLAWWFLAKASSMSGDIERENVCYEKAMEVIFQLGDMIGDKLYRQSFLEKFPISEILVHSGKLI